MGNIATFDRIVKTAVHCFCIVETECERLRERAKRETNQYEFCLAKVQEMLDGTYRETLDGEVLMVPKTEEAAHHLYECCMGRT